MPAKRTATVFCVQGGHLPARKYAAGTTKTSQRCRPQFPLLHRMVWQATAFSPSGCRPRVDSCLNEISTGHSPCKQRHADAASCDIQPDIARQRLAHARTKSCPSLAGDRLSVTYTSGRALRQAVEGIDFGRSQLNKPHGSQKPRRRVRPGRLRNEDHTQTRTETMLQVQLPLANSDWRILRHPVGYARREFMLSKGT